MPNKLLSYVLILSCFLLGGLIGYCLFDSPYFVIPASIVGLLIGYAGIRMLKMWLALDLHRIIGGFAGVAAATILSSFVISIIDKSIQQPALSLVINLLILVLFSLVGLQLGSSKAKELKRKVESASGKVPRIVGILDTSVIIDGRIADVCETGFLDGDLIIPQFVLKELQMIADSSESTKRTRGRRGLDILNKIKKQSFVKIMIEDMDYPAIKEVDQKLIHMAKETGHPILTNDYNLNKVAEVQSIQVLNINQLANSLKPIVLPGETMKVQILKEGKEHGQGVAYLDDGTMVVVDNGRKFIGKTAEATVTSVLQTTAGRMIFAVIK